MIRTIVLASLVFVFTQNLTQSVSFANSAAELLPPSTVLYAEINDPPGLVNSILDHPYTGNVKRLDAYQEAIKDPKFIGFMFGLRFVEAQLGMKWQQAIEDLSSGGVTIAFDAQTEGAVVLINAKSSEKLEALKNKLMTLARRDAASKGNPDPFEEKEYRSVTAYQAGDGGFFTHEEWLVLVNKKELAQFIADALLDGTSDSLATVDNFQNARESRSSNAVAWGYVNTDMLRKSDDEGLQKLFSGQADDPGGELISGGLLEALKETPAMTASVLPADSGFSLEFQVPFDRISIPDTREHFFGPRGTGRAGDVIEVPNTLASLSVYRNVSEMWLRAGDLFDEKANDNLAQADATLTTLFSGKDFAEDILGALHPNYQMIATRQTFAEDRPTPAIKLPAFALIAEMKDPEATTREFRRIFQSFVGFLNIVGAMEGNPQLDLGFDNFEGGELISSTFVPEIGEEEDRDARIQFNFSPTLAFAGDRVILASTTEIARAIAMSTEDAAIATEQGEVVNTHFAIDSAQLKEVLADNESHLIAQNMLKEGHTRKEAEQQIGTLLAILDLFEGATMQLSSTESTFSLDFEFVVKQ